MFEVLLNSENFKSSHRLMSQEVPDIYVLPPQKGQARDHLTMPSDMLCIGATCLHVQIITC